MDTPETDTAAFGALTPFFQWLFDVPHAATGVFDPWNQASTDDLSQGFLGRRRRLIAHLSVSPILLLVGEAPGYRGCRITGVPFTSESLILEHKIPRLLPERLSTRARPWAEGSATQVVAGLTEHGLLENTIMWNAFPWHPFDPSQGPLSNRTPRQIETQPAEEGLALLLAGLPANMAVAAVGRVAEQALARVGRQCARLRHPSMGGSKVFSAGLTALAARMLDHRNLLATTLGSSSTLDQLEPSPPSLLQACPG